MELALSLGDSTKQYFPFLDKQPTTMIDPSSSSSDKDLGFCMGLDVGFGRGSSSSSSSEGEKPAPPKYSDRFRVSSTTDPPLKLDLRPFSPVPRSNQLHFPWPPENGGSRGGRRVETSKLCETLTLTEEETDHRHCSVTSSSFCLDFGIRSDGKREEMERSASRASDEEENVSSTRKKLRLSKEQSAFLEESFKEHSTLNPTHKLALAKQLNLRPRQVEVWFQNRRARTKLKQTEVDCEYLKRCCETLTEENRRLQKELQELRALKSSRPFYMQLPATTLTICPSCERVGSTATAAAPPSGSSPGLATSLSRPAKSQVADQVS
ncbi:PREDICTED: homeobox-leucine zipper protein HAT14-like [Tarenaya hassleriana]|uniref:homeobox-leucine zipper protein HAT14-like n=1 Tax=Tarenaya hassleriana TaxID=28532 RepID=UPI00053CA983|nr:PREDICTED: homeobox-leucine zipper protein HAT14-like [Tarenaya hassleriana]